MSEYWDHQFTKNGKEVQIGEEPFYDNSTRPIMAQPMVCVHCHTEFVQGQQSRPAGPCPARQTKKEMRRLKNGG